MLTGQRQALASRIIMPNTTTRTHTTTQTNMPARRR
jgi:hypothetical protein